jgi:hypothetical protein
MFVGEEDPLSAPQDTAWAYSQIQPSSRVHYEEIPNFDHESFTLGKNMTYVDTIKSLVDAHSSGSKSVLQNLLGL